MIWLNRKTYTAVMRASKASDNGSTRSRKRLGSSAAASISSEFHLSPRWTRSSSVRAEVFPNQQLQLLASVRRNGFWIGDKRVGQGAAALARPPGGHGRHRRRD